MQASLRALAKQFINLAVLILVVSTVLFFLLRLTGDPAAMLAGPDATAEQLAAIRGAYGLDQPLAAQFFSYIIQMLQGDFGRSLATSQPAIELVLASLPATLSLAGLALLLAFVAAVPLGAWIGAQKDGFGARVASALVFVLQGTPGFVAGLLLIQVFAVQLRWLPSMGLLGGISYILPVVTLALFLMPKQTRLVAANVAGAYRQDYVRTARAIGAGEATILFRHVLPNALVGSIALLGAQAALLLSGAVITETIFGWPGLGALLLTASQTLDFPVIQAIAVVTALLVFLANAAADLAVFAIDPRIRDGLGA